MSSTSSDDMAAMLNMGELYTTLESNFDNATTPKSYVIVILDANWPILESRRNNVNEIWRKINGGGEKFYHNYDQEWDDGDTCLLERFSIPSIL
ncbi:hypothetical protein DdX_19904 [Ditylenchus destructor]|uniref:Uncharacterized protein n=1 Tax=Ditylenchus destructor TaxID=166010 RepID=A0AAD4QX10_9BILA|nr:hypothetical protein DdX_19904 [Ditylenchus destructor]